MDQDRADLAREELVLAAIRLVRARLELKTERDPSYSDRLDDAAINLTMRLMED